MKNTYAVYRRITLFNELTNEIDIKDELIGVTKAVSSKQAINNVRFRTKIELVDTWGIGYQETSDLYAKEFT